MFEHKINYHHQKDQGNVLNSREVNPQAYNHYYNNQNKQRPQSEKMNKDPKRIKQQQYRQSLDQQIENEKRIRDMNQERRNLNSAGIDQGDKAKGCFKPSSGTEWVKREKEMERLKKLEYNLELKKQIEARDRIKAEEKQKRQDEEKKIDSMFNKSNDGMQMKVMNKSSDKLKLESLNCISYSPATIQMNNQKLYPIHEETPSLQSSGIGQQNTPSSQYIGLLHTQPHFYSNSTNQEGYTRESMNYPLSCPQQYLPNRPMTTYNLNSPQPMPLMMTDSMQVRGRPISQPYYLPQPLPQQPQPITVESLFHNFVNDQINVISEYESKLENFDEGHYDNKVDVIGMLTQEKQIAMERIKHEQDKISTCLGFYPMQNGYNMKITTLLNKMLDSKLETIQQKKLIASTNNLPSYCHIPIYATQPETIASSVHKSNPNLYYSNNLNPSSMPMPIAKPDNLNASNSNQPNPMISQAGYRSKYEGFVKESIINAEEVNPEFKQSLIGFSKFVSVNTNNISAVNNASNTSSFLLQTWKGETDESRLAKNKPNLSQIKEEEVKYNIPQSQILMTDLQENNDEIGDNKDNNCNRYSHSGMKATSLVNKDISAIMLSPMDYPNTSGNKSNLNFDIINNNDISAIPDENGKFNVSHLQIEDSLINGMKICKEEKDKTLIFRPNKDDDVTNGNLLFNSYLEGLDNDITTEKKHNAIFNDDEVNDQCNISLSSKSKEEKPKEIDEEEEYHFDNEDIPSDLEADNKKEVEAKESNEDDSEEYKNDFTNDYDIAKLAQENNANLEEDYKEIRESQIEAKLNFFDDTINASSTYKNSPNQNNCQPKEGLKESEILNDSYGNDILKGMAMYHKMAMGNDK